MAEPQFPPIDIAGEGALFARLHTTQGVVVISLEEERTPKTVRSFVGLATGSIDWEDPKTRKGMAGTPMYDGIRFHRVIPGFMVQVGDPFSRYDDDASRARWGTGGPGYRFGDEIDPSLRHDGAGILSMANAGPGTNGSQFFITEGPTPHLDGRHTVFGRVVVGQDVIGRIANVPRDGRDRPNDDQKIERVEVFRSESVPTA
ncbi:MAG: peptidylprolyl isomerase [Myxococcales bacterium]|nr:peptidylprolyl isomerase [Myxococcales bacterium]